MTVVEEVAAATRELLRLAGGEDALVTRLAAARPRAVTVAHYDPARDYQAGLQRAGPPETAERVEVPAVIAADVARTLAAALVGRRPGGCGGR